MEEKKEFGLMGLTAVVVGSMIGGGIFNMPKEIAQTSSVGAALIGWIISGIGVFFIAKTFQILSYETPDLTDGIYKYAKVGFGKYAGFNSAWGYWISNVISNASYPVLIVQTLDYFFPGIGGIRTFQGIILGSSLIWVVTFIVMKGPNTTKILNNLATIGKVVAIFMTIIIIFYGFNDKIFFNDFWGKEFQKTPVFDQVKGCMLQTLWAFVGVEGAVIISGRAKNEKQVGRATMLGYFISLVLYVVIVIFSYSVIPDDKLANLKDPALSYIVEAVIGPIGATLVNIAVFISVTGAWLTWTLLTAEIPYNVAVDKIFPAFLSTVNKKGTNVGAILTNGVLKQIIFLVSLAAGNAYLAITNAGTSMILVPYIFSSLFLLKISLESENYNKKNALYASLAVIYGIWMLYASGLNYLFQSTAIYSLGIIFFIMKSKEENQPIFTNKIELSCGILLTFFGAIAFYYIIK